MEKAATSLSTPAVCQGEIVSIMPKQTVQKWRREVNTILTENHYGDDCQNIKGIRSEEPMHCDVASLELPRAPSHLLPITISSN